MSLESEPFNATWRFLPDLSNLSSPDPRSWFHTIATGPETISVHEEIERQDGSRIVQRIQGRLDGADYPIEGNPAFDTVAYVRTGPNTIAGTGKKKGVVCLKETMTVEPDSRKLTLVYNYLIGGEVIATGLAVFQGE